MKQEKTPTKLKGSSRMALWSVVLIGLIATTFFIVWFAASPPSSPSPKPVQTEPSGIIKPSLGIGPGDWVEGSREARTVLVEYSDFQCPACRAYAPLVKQLHTELGDQLAIVYRHFPLSNIHQHAQMAAQVAEAAGLQGKFWDMHDLMFNHQEEWSKEENPMDLFLKYAEELSLDLEKFQKDLHSQQVKQAIRENVQSGALLIIEGTPTFFLNEIKIQNPQSYGAFRTLILNEIGPTP
ncbi:MAG TPA: thioredoxin domain-containing protein [Nitrospiria bacterium]